jgi:hypothetical protein
VYFRYERCWNVICRLAMSGIPGDRMYPFGKVSTSIIGCERNRPSFWRFPRIGQACCQPAPGSSVLNQIILKGGEGWAEIWKGHVHTTSQFPYGGRAGKAG